MTAFHQHLDACKQCRENPFDLCRVGSWLLQAAADAETTRILKGVRR